MGILDDFVTEKLLELLNSPDVGGLAGVVDRLQSRKLVGVISSWIGTGKKIPITAKQIRQVFGPER